MPMASMHSSCQDDQKEVQQNFLVMWHHWHQPHDTDGTVNCTIRFHNSRQPVATYVPHPRASYRAYVSDGKVVVLTSVDSNKYIYSIVLSSFSYLMYTDRDESREEDCTTLEESQCWQNQSWKTQPTSMSASRHLHISTGPCLSRVTKTLKEDR